MIDEFVIYETLPQMAWVSLSKRYYSISICGENELPYGLTCRAIRDRGSGEYVHPDGSGVKVFALGETAWSIAGGDINWRDFVVPDSDGRSVSVGRRPRNRFVGGICFDENVKIGDQFRVVVWPQWIGETL